MFIPTTEPLCCEEEQAAPGKGHVQVFQLTAPADVPNGSKHQLPDEWE